MKKLYVFIIGLIFNISVFATDWKSQGLKLVEENQSEESNDAVVADKNDNQFKVSYTGELQASTIKILKKLHANFLSWESIKIKEIKFLVSNGDINIVINPSEYTYKEVNFLDYISSGMYFSFKGTLTYNFRIAVNKVFVVIKGSYSDETALSEKIASAIKDPRGYMARRDPEYLLEKLESMELNHFRLKQVVLKRMTGRLLDPAMINKVVEAKKQNPAMTANELTKHLKEKEIKVSSSHVRAIFQVYFNEF